MPDHGPTDRRPSTEGRSGRCNVGAVVAALIMLLVATGCVTDRSDSRTGNEGGGDDRSNRSAVDLRLETVVSDLDGPTQFVIDGSSFVVAQLNGGENDGVGQVIEVDQNGDVTVLFGGLDKPTGVLVRGDEVWVMERDRLSRGPRGGGQLTVVVDDLPNNGRSQGTLTLTPDGDVLFNTSGSARGGVVVERSGRLWTAGDDGQVIEYASGFKNAYAHTFDADGALWTTEIGDGRFDGEPPADEIVSVIEGVDHGWPRCVGDNRPVAEFGVSDCDGVPPSYAVFPPQATPTGIAISPTDPDRLMVALWSTGQLVSMPRTRPGPPLVEVEGLSGPQHLVADDGGLYMSEFGPGRIVRIVDRNR